MKKTILLGSLLALFVMQSCNKESVLDSQNLSTGSETHNNQSNQKNAKVNVVHNGNTISISENALMSHLSHGDKIGTIADNVRLQGIVLGETALDFNDPLYVSFRNSTEFQLYDATKFGQLSLNNAKMITTISINAIVIPVIVKNHKIELGLVGYVLSTPPSGATFKAVVMSNHFIVNSTLNIAGITFANISGEFSFFETTGVMITNVKISNNNIDHIDNGDDLERQSCFSRCFKTGTSNCSNSLPCTIACGIINAGTANLGWPISIAACCAIGCAATGGHTSGCNESS